ncbi:MAG: hypothetical protein P1U53_01920 [Sulfitobacter sp.]|nr:hypothetical protein [Sulfitobacter sp.]
MKDLLRISLPITLWLISFSAIYGLHGLVCSARWAALGNGLAPAAALAVAALVALVLQGIAVVLVYLSPAGSVRMRFVSRALAIVALVALVWTVLPVAFTTSCI